MSDDIIYALLDVLGIGYRGFPYSKDLLSERYKAPGVLACGCLRMFESLFEWARLGWGLYLSA